MNAQFKEIFRSLKGSLMRFIYISSIIALGVGFFTGIKATAPSMRTTATEYITNSRLSDFRLVSTYGLRDEDLERLRGVEGVYQVIGGYSMDLIASIHDEKNTVKFMSLPVGENLVNEPRLIEGRMPQEYNECVLEYDSSHLTQAQIGDTVNITEEFRTPEEIQNLATRQFSIVGFIQSPQYISIERGNTDIGNGSLDGYVEVLPEAFHYERFTDGYIYTDISESGTNPYSDEYSEAQKQMITRLEQVGDEILDDNLKSIKASGAKEINNAQEELEKQKAEAEKQFADAQKTIDDGRRQLEQGLRDYDSGLQSFRTQIGNAENQLAEARAKLNEGLTAYNQALEEFRSQIAAAEAELDSGEAQYNEGLASYNQGSLELETQISSGRAEIAHGRQMIEEGYRSYYENLENLEQTVRDTRKQIQDSRLQLDQATKEFEEKRPAAEKQIAEANEKITKSQAELDQKYEEFNKAQEAFDEQIEEQQAELDQGYKQYEELKKQYEELTGEPFEPNGEENPEAPNDSDNTEAPNDSESQKDSNNTEAQKEKAETSNKSGKSETVKKTESSKTAEEKKSEQVTAKQTPTEPNQDDSVPTETPTDPEELKAQLETMKAELDEKQKQLDEEKASKQAELDQQKAQLDQAQEELNKQKAEVEEQQKQLEQTEKDLENSRISLNQAEADLITQENETREKLNQAYLELQNQSNSLNQAEIELNQAELEGNAKLSEAKSLLDSSRIQLDSAHQLFNQQRASGEAQINAAGAEVRSGESELEAGEAELASQRSAGQAQLDQAYSTLENSENELTEGQEELNTKREDAEVKFEDAQNKINTSWQDLNNLSRGDWYVYSRDDNPGYSAYEQDSERIDRIGNVFPVFFLFVAVLVAFTTMTRMVEEERTQIGTLYALGFTKLQIMSKYIIYAGLAALIGTTLGWLIGVFTLPLIIFTAYSLIYNLPQMSLSIPWNIVILSYGVALLCTVGAAMLVAYLELRSVPAELMRPKAPKPGKRILLERIPLIWNRLNFITKVSMRNIFRYKARFLMTVVGVAGCTALIFAGFGLKDAIFSIVPNQFGEIFKYDQSLIIKGTDTALLDKLGKVLADERVSEAAIVDQESITISTDEGSIDCYLIVPKNLDELENYISLRDRDTRAPLTLGDDSIIVSDKIAANYNANPDNIVNMEIDKKVYKVKVAAIADNYLENYVYMSATAYQKMTGVEPDYSMIFINFKDGVTTEDQDDFASSQIASGEFTSSISVSALVDSAQRTIQSLNVIVLVMIGSALLLAFIVLNNLTTINISERLREIATLKVLGFRSNETNNYILRENIFLACFGIVLGLFLGYWLLQFIIYTINMDIISFGREIYFTSYLYSVVLTLLFTIIVNFTMIPVIRKINMVEALKDLD